MVTRFLLALALMSLLLFSGCSDDDCALCPQTESPTLQYPVVGYWCACECEGFPMDYDGMKHALTLRNDGTYTECESGVCPVTFNGIYTLSGDTLRLSAMDAPTRAIVVWIAKIGRDQMVLKRHASDKFAAWVYTRSTAN